MEIVKSRNNPQFFLFLAVLKPRQNKVLKGSVGEYTRIYENNHCGTVFQKLFLSSIYWRKSLTNTNVCSSMFIRGQKISKTHTHNRSKQNTEIRTIAMAFSVKGNS